MTQFVLKPGKKEPRLSGKPWTKNVKRVMVIPWSSSNPIGPPFQFAVMPRKPAAPPDEAGLVLVLPATAPPSEETSQKVSVQVRQTPIFKVQKMCGIESNLPLPPFRGSWLVGVCQNRKLNKNSSIEPP